MKTIRINITDTELSAIESEGTNLKDWLTNCAKEKARKVKDRLKERGEWNLSIAALAKDDGDIMDDWAILSKGIELGYFKHNVIDDTAIDLSS